MRLRLPRLIVTLFFLAAAALLLLPSDVLPQRAALGGALALAAIGLWATNAIPEHLTSLLFFLVAMVFGIAEASAVFSGFASSAFWLLFGGMIVGTAVRQTGLGARLARSMAQRLGTSYTGILVGIMAVALALAFVMPSSIGRAVLMMPIAISLADAFGFDPGRPGRIGIAMTAGLGAFLPGFGVLPANVPNLVLVGAADTLYGLKLTYGDYLLLHFPVLASLKAVLIVAANRVLFPDRPDVAAADGSGVGAFSPEERRLAVVLIATVVLWATDFLHGLSPAWVALGAGIACLMPPVSLIQPDRIGEAVQLRPLLYVGGVLSLGAVVTASGTAEHMAQGFLSVAGLGPGADARNFFTVVLASLGISVMGTAPTVPAVLTPLADQLATAMGLPLATVLMMQVPAFSTVLMPFQGPPIIVAMQLGQVPMRDGIRATLSVGLTTLVLLLPLDYLWWQVLGRFDD